MSDDTVWIKTEPTLDGSGYVVIIEADDDTARTLTPDAAVQYAWGVLEVAHRAAYDAAVARQMTVKLGLDTATVAQLLEDLRGDRPELSAEATAPLRLEPGVNQKMEPFITIRIGTKPDPVGQWTFEDARQHALAALELVKVADLDGAYLKALVGLVGIDRARAHQVIDDLGNFR